MARVLASEVMMDYRIEQKEKYVSYCVCEVCGYSEVIDWKQDGWGHSLQECMENLGSQIAAGCPPNLGR